MKGRKAKEYEGDKAIAIFFFLLNFTRAVVSAATICSNIMLIGRGGHCALQFRVARVPTARCAINEQEIITHDRVAAAPRGKGVSRYLENACRSSRKRKRLRPQRFAPCSFREGDARFRRESARQNVLQRFSFALRIDTRSECARRRNFI